MLKLMGEEKGIGYMKKLAAQDLRIQRARGGKVPEGNH